MRRPILAVLLLVLPAAAHAEMSVATFLGKAEALKKKGMFALMSSDIGVLKKEVGVASATYRDEIKAARAAGRVPHSCPPPKAAMNSDELMAHFRTLPGSASVKTGFYSLMKTRYPCPA
jgi:hypothetical protein